MCDFSIFNSVDHTSDETLFVLFTKFLQQRLSDLGRTRLLIVICMEICCGHFVERKKSDLGEGAIRTDYWAEFCYTQTPGETKNESLSVGKEWLTEMTEVAEKR